MSFSLLPRIRCEALTDLTPGFLTARGIHLLMLDFDNTIVPYITNEPTEKMQQWLKDMLASQVQICVVSNSKRDRVKVFCQAYGIDCITHAAKPFPNGIRACLAKYGADPRECAIVGDQIFTDTLGGNCAGLTSILVRPINNHNFWLKARHVLEQPFIFMARNRRISHEKS